MRAVGLILAAAMLLASCATAGGDSKLSARKPRASFPPYYGVIAGVFTTPERWRLDRWIHIRNVETRKEYRISQSFAFGSGDFDDGEKKGIVFAQALPPGEYEIYNYQVYSANGAFETRWYARDDFSVRFIVAPGSVNYLGDIEFAPHVGKNFLGMAASDGGFFRILDRSTRDMGPLESKFPDVDWTRSGPAALAGMTLPPEVGSALESAVGRAGPPPQLQEPRR